MLSGELILCSQENSLCALRITHFVISGDLTLCSQEISLCALRRTHFVLSGEPDQQLQVPACSGHKKARIWGLRNIQVLECEVICVQCSVHCAVCIMQCAVFSVQCSVFCIDRCISKNSIGQAEEVVELYGETQGT